MATHTPGPWYAIDADLSGYGQRINRNADGFAWDLAHVCNAPNGTANARLIAAAPEMLETLKWLDSIGGLGLSVHARISRAIAKAEGQ